MTRIKKDITGDQLTALDMLVETIVDEFLEMLLADPKLKKKLAKTILEKSSIRRGLLGNA